MKYLVMGLVLWLWAPWTVAQGQVLFEEDFGGGELESGWHWRHDAPQSRQLADGKLRLQTKGSLWQSENSQLNLLLRAAPGASTSGYAVEVTVSNRADLTERYEHGGLIWYLDDDNWVTLTQLNHVQHKTQKIMLVHETEGDGRAGDSSAEPHTEPWVDLRLVVEGRRFTGFYRASANDPWRRLGSLTFPRTAESPRIGLTAGQGPDTSGHWVTFQNFSIRRLDADGP